MPHLMLNASFFESSECYELCEALDYDNAGIYIIRLWCHGIRTENVTGQIKFSDRALAEIARYKGDPGAFRKALVETRFLIPEPGARTYYMRGWSRNKGYFAKKAAGNDRVRRFRERQKEAKRLLAERNALQDADFTSPLIVVPDETPCNALHVTDTETDLGPRYIRSIKMQDFEELCKNEFKVPGAIPAAHIPRLRALIPLSRAEVDIVWEKMKLRPGTPNWGFLIKGIEMQREDAAEAVAPPSTAAKRVTSRRRSGSAAPPNFKDVDILRSLEMDRQEQQIAVGAPVPIKALPAASRGAK